MRYLEAEGAWLLDPPDGESFEIIVSGDQSGPDSACTDILQKILPRMAELRKKAIYYLEEFVERRKFAECSDWCFEGVSLERMVDNAGSNIGLHFSIEGDVYGEWSVSFQESGAFFYPVAFKRQQV